MNRRPSQPTQDLNLRFPSAREGSASSSRPRIPADLIDGVRIRPWSFIPTTGATSWRSSAPGQGLVAASIPSPMQVSAAYNYPGAIKAFHYHLHQTDCFTPVMGLLQIALVDLRKGSRDLRPAEHDLRRRAPAVAGADPARRRARLQGPRRPSRPCWSTRPIASTIPTTKAASPTTTLASTTTGSSSTNEACGASTDAGHAPRGLILNTYA